MARRKQPPPTAPSRRPDEIDLNQVVAYNIRAARELRGWTQDDLADRLEPYVGARFTQASISGIERAVDGERRRNFDAQELLMYSEVFDLPIIWFLLPPPDDHRTMRHTTRPVDELYAHVLGRPDQLAPVYTRLRALGVDEPTAAEVTVEKITGQPSPSRQWSYQQRRKDLVLAMLDDHADRLDKAADELGGFFDHLRQVGIRGFVAEHTNDDDYARPSAGANRAARASTKSQASSTGTGTAKPARTRKRATQK
jgi:transcriptional regulator with XRE-family HTH domain